MPGGKLVLHLYENVSMMRYSELGLSRTTKHESNRKAMNGNWSNQKANPALKTKTGNK